MSDFPILKWVNVDGRSVPFTYPQHKKDGGYVETGDENPLPVGNHVMSEGGLWIPEPEVRSTQLTGSIVELEVLENVFVPAGSYVTLSGMDIDNSDIKEIRGSIRWEGDTTYSLELSITVGSRQTYLGEITDITKSRYGDLFKHESYDKNFRIRVNNDSGTDRTLYALRLMGVR